MNYGSPTSDDWQVISSEVSLVEEHEMFSAITSQLINILSEKSCNVRVEDKEKLFGHIVKLEYYIIWTNSDCSLIRESAVRGLLDVLQVCPREITQEFIQMHGFHLVANQLKSYDATQKLFAELYAYCLGAQTASLLDDIKFARDWTQFTSSQVAAFEPLFALLVSSVKDTHLCHLSLQAMNSVLEHIPFSSPVLKYLFDNGIAECFANVLIESEIIRTNVYKEDESFYNEDTVYDDVLAVLYTLAFSLFNSAGGIFFEAYNDLLDLFISLRISTSGRLSALLQEALVVLHEAGVECMIKHAAEARNGQPKRFLNVISGR